MVGMIEYRKRKKGPLGPCMWVAWRREIKVSFSEELGS